MKTKGEKVTYQWLSYNHRNFHCTRFPIFRWTEPCCSTYDEQTDRVELTTAIGELALSYIRTRTTAHEISDSRMLDFRWHYWIGLLGVSKSVKIPNNTIRRKKNICVYPIQQFLNGALLFFFFNYRLGLELIIFWKTHWFQLWLIWKGGFIDYWWFIKLVAEAPNWVTMHSTSVP